MADQFIVAKKLWKQNGAKNWTVYVEPNVNNPLKGEDLWKETRS
jgi:hypothetical protein